MRASHTLWAMGRFVRQVMRPAALRAATYCLDTIAPPDPVVREIELMTPEEFWRTASVLKATPDQDGAADAQPKSKNSPPRKTLPARTIALLPYRNVFARTALVEIKSVRNVTLAGILARAVYPHMMERLEREMEELNPERQSTAENGDRRPPILAVIPMTKKALRARGWNQCELLAREMSAIDGGARLETRLDALIKIRDTDDQVGKNREGRMKNISTCMSANPRRDVADRTVVVLDDIITTGATLGEARRALLQAGARAVICVAVAF